MRPLLRHAWLLAALSLSGAIAFAQGPDDVPALDRFELLGDRFQGSFGRTPIPAFDVIATDMDLDGDPDVLANWHMLHPLELFENDGGHFRRARFEGRDASGLEDAPGVPSLFADTDSLVPRILEDERPGLYLWHETARSPSAWRFLWLPDADAPRALQVAIATNDEVVSLKGLLPGEFERTGARSMRVSLPLDDEPRLFLLRSGRVATELRLHFDPTDGPAPSLFVGPERARVTGEEASFWKPDPHGIAWVDLEDSPHPELFVTRGGLIGSLAPPEPGKLDRYFLYRGLPEARYGWAPEGTVARDYGRSRTIQTVDVDGDGVLEVSISCEESPNRLLFRTEDGRFEDRAAALGLDFTSPVVQTWADHDGDGWQDLYFVDEGGVHLARSLEGERFAILEPQRLGLVFQGNEGASIFSDTQLTLTDFDADGALDLFVAGAGRENTSHLFLRRGEVFVEERLAAALARPEEPGFLVTGDFDGDGDDDLLRFERRPTKRVGVKRDVFLDFHEAGQVPPRFLWPRGRVLLWENDGAAGFTRRLLAGLSDVDRIHAATPCDVDGDGHLDVVGLGWGRYVLRNRGAAASALPTLLVQPRRDGGEPVGTLVTAAYSDGTRVARRYGSEPASKSSQALAALRFGQTEERRVEELWITWAGSSVPQRFEVPEGAGRLEPRPQDSAPTPASAPRRR